MLKGDHTRVHVGRRDFLKTTTMAGMAATLPEAFLQGSEGIARPENKETKGNCSCWVAILRHMSI